MVNHFFFKITKNNAEILIEEGFNCEYKGNTMLKGKGEVVTYLVHPT